MIPYFACSSKRATVRTGGSSALQIAPLAEWALPIARQAVSTAGRHDSARDLLGRVDAEHFRAIVSRLQAIDSRRRFIRRSPRAIASVLQAIAGRRRAIAERHHLNRVGVKPLRT